MHYLFINVGVDKGQVASIYSLHYNKEYLKSKDKEMVMATLTSKRQITLPKQICDHFKLHAGDRVEFLMSKTGVSMTPVTVDVSELKGCLPKPKKLVSLEQMNKIFAKRGSAVV
jgi:antitoxin PrlF